MNDILPPRPPGPHPTPEQLYLAHGREDEESKRVLRHAADCAECSLELARQEAFNHPEGLSRSDLEAAWQRFGREPEARTRRSGYRPPVFALAATLAVCIVGLGLWVTKPEHEAVNVERGAPVMAEGWQPTGLLDSPPAEFTFPAPQGEPRRVRVFDAAQDYAWTSEPAAGGRIPFPESERQRLRPGVEYFWTVLDGGEGSAARSFRVQP